MPPFFICKIKGKCYKTCNTNATKMYSNCALFAPKTNMNLYLECYSVCEEKAVI